jgi:hypothetical protein
MPAIQNNIRMIIRSRIIFMIKNDLTIGRRDAGLQPFSDIAIQEFIAENLENIQAAVQAIISDYEEDDELDQLVEPENSMILEYLYDFVNTHV